ncbi:hypothetical protein [Leptolyngbya sp. FACHB-261]|uniref:hypothetical protein n=1 Tax=Leptolyngbya sp. FACHB-261 TaxID=2692806 RepID=UPI001689B81D|nr:hypothetical protein [Leptolyngbya sp. FACHB-261]MBD2102759.1 hypothetical protein [Leptolyngbya sp. FACHB-261]
MPEFEFELPTTETEAQQRLQDLRADLCHLQDELARHKPSKPRTWSLQKGLEIQVLTRQICAIKAWLKQRNRVVEQKLADSGLANLANFRDGQELMLHCYWLFVRLLKQKRAHFNPEDYAFLDALRLYLEQVTRQKLEQSIPEKPAKQELKAAQSVAVANLSATTSKAQSTTKSTTKRRRKVEIVRLLAGPSDLNSGDLRISSP